MANNTVPARFSAAATRALIAEGIEDYEQDAIEENEWLDNMMDLHSLYSELHSERKALDRLAEDIDYAELVGFSCKLLMDAYEQEKEYIRHLEEEISALERLV